VPAIRLWLRCTGAELSAGAELVKTFAIIALVLSTLFVLIWPLVLMMLAFMNDNPKGSETLMTTFNVLVVYYPLGWIVALISLLVRRIGKSPKKWWESPIPYLFLSPFAQLAIAGVVLALYFIASPKG
jgi:uncharacterized membrane protein YhaH (DUF805 family)